MKTIPKDLVPLLVQNNHVPLGFLVVQEVLSLHLLLVLLSVLLEINQHKQVLLFHPFHQEVLENLWGLALLVSQEFQEVPRSQSLKHML
jgi:hypothetical protein